MDFAKYSTKLAENSIEAPNTTCLLWTGTTRRESSKIYGVINVLIGGRWRVMHVHRVAYYCREHNIVSSSLDISHLCHNALCIRGEHLSAEPHHVNNNRQVCLSKGECMGHRPYADCILQ